MGFLDKLFGKSPPETPKPPEHAVIVHFEYGSTDLQPLFALERRLGEAIVAASAGEYDGNAIASDGSDGFLYMYGPDAERLYQVILPVLRPLAFMHGATVTLRFGPATDPASGKRETTITPA